jgi:hypothetical protein
MKTITITELQSNFDKIITEVENGKTFIIESEYGNVALVPYDEYKELDDLVKIYTDHEEGC